MKRNNTENKRFVSFIRILVTVFCVFAILPVASLYAEQPVGNQSSFTIDTHKGLRSPSLETSPVPFKIKGNDLAVYETGVKMEATLNNIYSKASINVGSMMSRDALRKSLEEEARRFQGNQSFKDDIKDLCVGLGYKMDFLDERLNIIPLAGLSYHANNLHPSERTGGSLPSLIGTDGLSQTFNAYESQWRSWFLGFDMKYELPHDFLLKSSFAYHTADYEAAANFDSSKDVGLLTPSTQIGNGEGAVVNVSLNRVIAKRWLIGLMYGYEDWSTQPGNSHLLGKENLGSDDKSNNRWGNQSINVSIGYNF